MEKFRKREVSKPKHHTLLCTIRCNSIVYCIKGSVLLRPTIFYIAPNNSFYSVALCWVGYNDAKGAPFYCYCIDFMFHRDEFHCIALMFFCDKLYCIALIYCSDKLYCILLMVRWILNRLVSAALVC